MTLQKLSEMLLVLIFSHGDQTKKFRRIKQNYFRLSCSCMTAIEVNIRLSLIENLIKNAQRNHDSWISLLDQFLLNKSIQHDSAQRRDFRKKSVGPTCEASMRKSCGSKSGDGCWDGDHSEVEGSSGAGNPTHKYIMVILLSTANILVDNGLSGR